MSYQTYTTEALVCGTYDRNTADRSYRLFARELGMLFADARSVRLEKSRQRMALSDFSLVRVSLENSSLRRVILETNLAGTGFLERLLSPRILTVLPIAVILHRDVRPAEYHRAGL